MLEPPLFVIILDMIGDADLQIPQEPHGLAWRDTRPLVTDIWATAKRLGVVEFVPRRGRLPIEDDHLMLHNVGKIPIIDLIDFVRHRTTVKGNPAIVTVKGRWVPSTFRPGSPSLPSSAKDPTPTAAQPLAR